MIGVGLFLMIFTVLLIQCKNMHKKHEVNVYNSIFFKQMDNIKRFFDYVFNKGSLTYYISQDGFKNAYACVILYVVYVIR